MTRRELVAGLVLAVAWLIACYAAKVWIEDGACRCAPGAHEPVPIIDVPSAPKPATKYRVN